MAFADCDGRWYLHKAIKDRGRRLRDGGRGPGSEYLRPRSRQCSPALCNFACSGNNAESNRGAEDLQVMIVDLILQALFPDLVKTVELVRSTL